MLRKSAALLLAILGLIGLLYGVQVLWHALGSKVSDATSEISLMRQGVAIAAIGVGLTAFGLAYSVLSKKSKRSLVTRARSKEDIASAAKAVVFELFQNRGKSRGARYEDVLAELKKRHGIKRKVAQRQIEALADSGFFKIDRPFEGAIAGAGIFPVYKSVYEERGMRVL